jgi:adenylosuccinate synthase
MAGQDAASNAPLAQVACVLGAQWGDEGKGKIVDCLAGGFDLCVRFNGGSNAGHSIKVGDKKFAFHLLPSGIVNPTQQCLVGAGVVVHIPTLLKELKQLDEKDVEWRGRFFLAHRAHLVFDFHQTIDGLNEGALPADQKIGTTKKGIGPAYMEKKNRSNLRMVDLRDINTEKGFERFKARHAAIIASAQRRFTFDYDAEKELEALKEAAKMFSEAGCFVDGVSFVHNAKRAGKKIMLEGANAAMLDIDYGTYPFVTSSNTTIGGAATGSGIAVRHIQDVIGVVKAYTTRVGEGPFPTELPFGDEFGDQLGKVGHEFGTTTGRARRCGWLDIPLLRFTTQLNGYTHINLTKLDVLDGFEEIKIATDYKLNGEVIDFMPASLDELAEVEVVYETVPGWKTDISKCKSFDELPKEAKAYIARIEALLENEAHIRWIGTGPFRENLLER